MMASNTPSKVVEGGLFDVDQVDPSSLYESEEDKMSLAKLPELLREQILAGRLEKLKKEKEMASALAAARRRSEVFVGEEKIYTPSKVVEGGLFDVDQVDPSSLYYCEEDKMLLAQLPELLREQILAERLEKLKKEKEMASALAAARRRSEVLDGEENVFTPAEKIYVPPMFRSPDHQSLPYFKNTNDDVQPSVDVVDSESTKQPARRTSPRKRNSESSKLPARRTSPRKRNSTGSTINSKTNNNPKQKRKQSKAKPKASSKKPAVDSQEDVVVTNRDKDDAKEPAVTLPIAVDSQEDVVVTNRDKDEKLLVYPFVAGDRIELAAKGLDLCDFSPDYDEDRLISVQLEHAVARNNFIAFTQLDFDKLNPRTCVNDSIISFWMLWICRREFPKDSNVFVLSSHFYTTLLGEGEEVVSRWVRNRNKDVFTKKIVIFPIHLDTHWSLLAAINLTNINAGKNVENTSQTTIQTSELPFLLHLDSAKLHSYKTIGRNVRNWLMYEWKQRNVDNEVVFNEKTMPIVCPSGKTKLTYSN
jgi:hypothetical protein